jgi:hypothetical protein
MSIDFWCGAFTSFAIITVIYIALIILVSMRDKRETDFDSGRG